MKIGCMWPRSELPGRQVRGAMSALAGGQASAVDWRRRIAVIGSGALQRVSRRNREPRRIGLSAHKLCHHERQFADLRIIANYAEIHMEIG